MMISVEDGGNYNGTASRESVLKSNASAVALMDDWPLGLDKNAMSKLYRQRTNLLSRMNDVKRSYWADITIDIYNPNLYPTAYSNISNETAPVGTIGLGDELSYDHTNPNYIYSITDQMTSENFIANSSWYMHLGSVALGQTGSLILGGYEENRILGDVGTFHLDSTLPRVILVDVLLDFEAGPSPYNTTVGSVWQSESLPAAVQSMANKYGGPAGSALVLPNAAAPYLYLPPEVCEAAASHLPVRWVPEIGLYVWEFHSDPVGTTRFVNSPASMAFVFTDENSRNITIKIPFRLLNLTIDRMPARENYVNWGVDTYWPCKPWTESDIVASSSLNRYTLGRAFLQGAFTGFNYDRERFFMAQAPGPGMSEQLIVPDNSQDLRSRPADTFVDTWREYWTELEVAAGGTGGTGGTPGTTPEATGDNSTPTSGLGTGAIAGIAVAAGCGLVALVALLWFFCWRARRRRNSDEEHKNENGSGRGLHDADIFTGGKAEMDGKGVPISELEHHDRKSALGEQQPQELPSPFNSPMNSSPGFSDLVFELPDGNWGRHEKGEKGDMSEKRDGDKRAE
ncbi:aspartic-type endopeptidase [Colletotrichum scovillei]|uniref:Aspartic-type endopeptidase n=2 Tax=Colletotrichum scovillei TaxID=1209932 RepID=A0A9P7UDB9_9PEZI|nr:aspartic-type endopeptidase [Colletotrichum scovillei]KAG7069939.1 aspartic-type endopeptidase [Colletotrichum scovillei]KAG7078189.1 aspartic-type endopeptidase [Colletotrichum scovillei]